MKRVFALALLLLAAAAPDLSGLAFAPHPGARVPLGDLFNDAAGARVSLGGVLAGRPGVLALGYYACPNLCGVVRGDLFAALSRSGLDARHDVSVVALSVDPRETPADAARAKAADSVPGARFLTGDAAAVARAVGFPFRPDERAAQLLHPVGLVVLTPAGVVSGYLLGVGYSAQALREAVRRAAASTIAPPPSPILLLCFHYDPSTGKYSLDILRAMRAAGVLTVIALGVWLAVAHARRRA